MKECSFCGRRAVYHQRYSGVYLCDRCLKRNIERRFRRTVKKEDLVESGDGIAVAVSGGTDSLTNLHLLAKYSMHRDVELIALTVNEGIKGYRDVSSIQESVKAIGTPHVVISFKEAFGVGMDQIAELTDEENLDPCTYCGILRRSLLNQAARELGADKITIAHNLDDEVQTIMMNYIRGDISRLSRLEPIHPKHKGLVPRMKPLREIPEKEIGIYALIEGLDAQIAKCPYAGGLRTEVRNFVNELELNHPTTKHKILRTFERIKPHLPSNYENFEMVQCEICGEPSAHRICRACELLEQLGIERKKKRLIPRKKRKTWRRTRPGS